MSEALVGQVLAGEAGGTPARLTTLLAADSVPVRELAQVYADNPWSTVVDQRAAVDDVEELAVARSLAVRLTEQLGLLMHRAILGGAAGEEVAAALGLGVSDAYRMWGDWAHDARLGWLTRPNGAPLPADIEQAADRWQDAVDRDGARGRR